MRGAGAFGRAEAPFGIRFGTRSAPENRPLSDRVLSVFKSLHRRFGEKTCPPETVAMAAAQVRRIWAYPCANPFHGSASDGQNYTDMTGCCIEIPRGLVRPPPPYAAVGLTREKIAPAATFPTAGSLWTSRPGPGVRRNGENAHRPGVRRRRGKRFVCDRSLPFPFASARHGSLLIRRSGYTLRIRQLARGAPGRLLRSTATGTHCRLNRPQIRQ